MKNKIFHQYLNAAILASLLTLVMMLYKLDFNKNSYEDKNNADYENNVDYELETDLFSMKLPCKPNFEIKKVENLGVPLTYNVYKIEKDSFRFNVSSVLYPENININIKDASYMLRKKARDLLYNSILLKDTILFNYPALYTKLKNQESDKILNMLFILKNNNIIIIQLESANKNLSSKYEKYLKTVVL